MAQERETYLTLTEANFKSEVLESSKPVLVDFWALLFFQNGEVVDQAIGAVPKKVLAEKLGALLPAA